jgi:integrase
MGEILQLNVEDFSAEDGLNTISTIAGIVESDDGTGVAEDFIRTQKTEAAARRIPVHPELIRLGLLNFVSEQKASGERRLFPNAMPDVQGYLSGPYSKWFARFLEKVGVKSRRNAFHSFRHSYRDGMRRANISRDVVLALGGWNERSFTSDGYGSGPSISEMHEELKRISFDELDLSHLYVS